MSLAPAQAQSQGQAPAQAQARAQAQAHAHAHAHAHAVQRFGYADVGFGQMHYVQRRNPGAAGLPLLLLNPRARGSLPLLPLLNRAERVVGIDLPGFGLSAPLPGEPEMRDIAAVFVACMDALDIARADLFGLHTGHKIATALALHWPERVGRLLVAGRSHSLIPDHAARNQAMQAVVDENQTDMAIIRMEGRYADETGTPRAFAASFKANFAFDFAAALRRVACPTLVIEIASAREDGLYGRQAEALIAGMADARAVVLPQSDPTGLFLYVGVETMADAINQFCGNAA